MGSRGGAEAQRFPSGLDRRRFRANEKLKVGSAVFANIGTALFLSAFGRWFLTGFDAWVGVWIVFSCMIIGVAVQSMSLLEPESTDG